MSNGKKNIKYFKRRSYVIQNYIIHARNNVNNDILMIFFLFLFYYKLQKNSHKKYIRDRENFEWKLDYLKKIQFVLYGETNIFTIRFELRLEFPNHPRSVMQETFMATLY